MEIKSWMKGEERKEDLFGGHVGMRQAERREGNIGDMCAAASNKPSIGGGAGRNMYMVD